jgi:hypothetical protein
MMWIDPVTPAAWQCHDASVDMQELDAVISTIFVTLQDGERAAGMFQVA